MMFIIQLIVQHLDSMKMSGEADTNLSSTKVTQTDLELLSSWFILRLCQENVVDFQLFSFEIHHVTLIIISKDVNKSFFCFVNITKIKMWTRKILEHFFVELLKGLDRVFRHVQL